ADRFDDLPMQPAAFVARQVLSPASLCLTLRGRSKLPHMGVVFLNYELYCDPCHHDCSKSVPWSTRRPGSPSVLPPSETAPPSSTVTRSTCCSGADRPSTQLVNPPSAPRSLSRSSRDS